MAIKKSTQGYKRNSPDRGAKKLRIPSNQITMENVDFPVIGTDDFGYTQIMQPGMNYKFPGNYVDETPMAQNGRKISNWLVGDDDRKTMVAQDGMELINPFRQREPINPIGRADMIKQEMKRIPSVDVAMKQAGRDLSKPTAAFTREPKNINWMNVGLDIATAAEALIPEQNIEPPVVYPGMSYNEHPYGTGSQAIAKHGGRIVNNKYQAGGEIPYNNPNYKQENPHYQTGGNIDSTGIYTRRILSDMDMADRSSGDLKSVFARKWNEDVMDYERYKKKKSSIYTMPKKQVHEELNRPFIQPKDTVKEYQAGGTMPGSTGAMYGRFAGAIADKVKKMEAGGDMPYNELLVHSEGGMNKRIAKYQNGTAKPIYTSYEQINKDNQFARDLLKRQNADPWMAENAHVARDIGDPVVEFKGGANTQRLPSTLPAGMSINDVISTSEGQYGYYHPQEGNFVLVDGVAVINKYGKKTTPMNINSKNTDVAKAFKKGGTLPTVYEHGGEYDISEEEIKNLIAAGYELKMK